MQQSHASDARVGVELPFPCVWVAPWTREEGLAPFRDTLAVTVSDPEAVDLADLLLQEPTVRNVYLGSVPTSWSAPGLPHDGYLADFLMETKSFVRCRPGRP